MYRRGPHDRRVWIGEHIIQQRTIYSQLNSLSASSYLASLPSLRFETAHSKSFAIMKTSSIFASFTMALPLVALPLPQLP